MYSFIAFTSSFLFVFSASFSWLVIIGILNQVLEFCVINRAPKPRKFRRNFSSIYSEFRVFILKTEASQIRQIPPKFAKYLPRIPRLQCLKTKPLKTRTFRRYSRSIYRESRVFNIWKQSPANPTISAEIREVFTANSASSVSESSRKFRVSDYIYMIRPFRKMSTSKFCSLIRLTSR